MAKEPNWTQEEVEYLKSVWEDMKVDTEEICVKLKRKRQAISAKARKLGLSRGYNCVFSIEEVEILKKYYPTMSAKELKERFFNDRTEEQISNAGYNHKIQKTKEYTETKRKEIGIENLIANNFNIDKSVERRVERIVVPCDYCGEDIIRTESELNKKNFCSTECLGKYSSIYKCGENNPNWDGGITEIYADLRIKIKDWKKKSMKNSGYKCVVTGEKFNDIHHLYPFKAIVMEAYEELGLERFRQVLSYDKEDYKNLVKRVIELHEKYPLGICLRDDIHNEFHNKYGRINNTPEQFYEFAKLYYGKDLKI